MSSTDSSSSSDPSENNTSPPEVPNPREWRSLDAGSVVVAIFLLFISGILVVMAMNRPVTLSSEHMVEGSPLYELIENMKIDINHANAVEWQVVPGIGPALAGKIIAEREGGGPFLTIEDLERVKGIGSRTIESIREYLVVTEEGDHLEVVEVKPAPPGE